MKRMSLAAILKAAALQAELEAPQPPSATELRRRDAEQWWNVAPGLFSLARRKLFSFEAAHAGAPADISYTPEAVCRIPALVVRDESDQFPIDVHVMSFETAGDELALHLRLSGSGLRREERVLQCAFVPDANSNPAGAVVADFTASKEAFVHVHLDENTLSGCRTMTPGGTPPFRLVLRPVEPEKPAGRALSMDACFSAFMSWTEKETAAKHRPGPAIDYVGKSWPAWWASHGIAVEPLQIVEDRHKFISGLERKFGDSARHILAQLAPLAPFRTWPELGSRGAFVPCVFLNQDRSDGWVARLYAQVRSSDTARVYSDNFVDPPGTVEHIAKASRSVLFGFGACILMVLWAVAGTKPYARWKKWLLRIEMIATIALTILLIGLPAESNLLQPAAVILLTLNLLLMATWLIFVVPVCMRAFRAGWRRRRLLGHSAVRLEISAENAPLPLLEDKDTSFTFAAAMAVLLAVEDAAPIGSEESWLWHNVLTSVRERAKDTVLTGAINAWGFNRPVEDIRDKCGVSARAGFRSFVAPLQRFRQAAPPRWHLVRSFHLADAVLRLGGLLSRRAVLVRLPAYLLLAVCALGSSGLVELASLAPAPRFAKGTSIQQLVAETEAPRKQLHLALNIPEYDQFAVSLLSSDLSNRWQRFYFDYRDLHAHALLDLVGVNGESEPALKGEIRLEQWRNPLFQPARWVSVLRAPLPSVAHAEATLIDVGGADVSRNGGGTMARQVKAAIGCMLALSACTTPHVTVSAQPGSEVPANGTLTLAAVVKNLGGELTYRWLPGRGRCVPQESRDIETTYYPPAGTAGGEDVVALEVLRRGDVAARGQITFRIVEPTGDAQQAVAVLGSPALSGSPSVTVDITRIPPYDALGGPENTASIAGAVRGAAPAGYRVVLYSFTDHWYVQPEVGRPYTTIDSSGHWTASIHLGSRYAALVTRGDFQPPARTGVLPSPGEDVVAVAVVEGRR